MVIEEPEEISPDKSRKRKGTGAGEEPSTKKARVEEDDDDIVIL